MIEAVWPALWPALVMTALLQVGRRLAPSNLFEVALHLAVGGLVYLVLFVGIAIGANERRFYLTKLRGMLARQPRVPAAAA